MLAPYMMKHNRTMFDGFIENIHLRPLYDTLMHWFDPAKNAQYWYEIVAHPEISAANTIRLKYASLALCWPCYA